LPRAMRGHSVRCNGRSRRRLTSMGFTAAAHRRVRRFAAGSHRRRLSGLRLLLRIVAFDASFIRSRIIRGCGRGPATPHSLVGRQIRALRLRDGGSPHPPYGAVSFRQPASPPAVPPPTCRTRSAAPRSGSS
jgi:Fe2+ transport system protein FeoA